MKRKCLKFISIVMILMNFVVIFNNFSLAYDPSTQVSTIDQKGITGEKVQNTTKNTVGTITRIIRIVGTGIAIIMLTMVAIKYMSAAPEDKAEFKKSAMAYIVGAILLFATSNVLAVIANFATSNISKETGD